MNTNDIQKQIDAIDTQYRIIQSFDKLKFKIQKKDNNDVWSDLNGEIYHTYDAANISKNKSITKEKYRIKIDLYNDPGTWTVVE